MLKLKAKSMFGYGKRWTSISETGKAITVKILLANDGSPHARAALKVVANRKWPVNSVVQIVVG
jgi:hypothetical protein